MLWLILVVLVILGVVFVFSDIKINRNKGRFNFTWKFLGTPILEINDNAAD